MVAFVVSKFDPLTDPSRPGVGDKFFNKDVEYEVRVVDYALTAELIKEIMHNTDADADALMSLKGFDEVFQISHPDRPMISWLIWVNKVQSPPAAAGVG